MGLFVYKWMSQNGAEHHLVARFQLLRNNNKSFQAAFFLSSQKHPEKCYKYMFEIPKIQLSLERVFKGRKTFHPVMVVDHFSPLSLSWSSPGAEAESSPSMPPIVSLYPHDDRGGGPVKNRGDPPRLHRFNYRAGDAVGVSSLLLLTGRGQSLGGGVLEGREV